MTTTTNTPPAPPAPPKRRRTAVPVAIAATAAFVVGGFTGGALTTSLGEDYDDSCAVAVVQANEAIDLYSDSLDRAADGIRGYSNNDPWAIREASDSLGENSDHLAPVLREYYTHEQECLSE